MSGLVDIGTSELAKLKNKGGAIFSSGSASPTQEAARADNSGGASLWWPTGLLQALQVNKLPALHCSEASLSMLMDSFSA